MNSFKSITFAALLTISAFTIATYTACKDACSNVVCLNGGTCQDGKCVCPSGVSGANCENDLCAVKDCQNGATCIDGKCQCASGYEGDSCQVLIAEKFFGNWLGKSDCQHPAVSEYRLVVDKGITKTKVIIRNAMSMKASVTGNVKESNVIVVPKQFFNDNNHDLEGTLTLDSNKLIFKFTYYSFGNPSNCSGEFTK